MIWIRSLLFVVAFYVFSAVAAIGASPVLLFGGRKGSINLINWWGKGVTGMLAVICDVKVEVRGRENLPTGAALIAAKHQCMFDIFGSFSFLPDSCYVLKKELLAIPFFGWYAQRSRMIAIDRGAHSAALKQMVRDARDRMTEERQLVIFPEGTRRAPGETPDYKPGIAALYRDLDMPVIPLALNTGAHWPPKGFLRRPGTIVFQFLEPIPAGLKRAEFMQTLEDRIEPACQALLDEGL